MFVFSAEKARNYDYTIETPNLEDEIANFEGQEAFKYTDPVSFTISYKLTGRDGREIVVPGCFIDEIV